MQTAHNTHPGVAIPGMIADAGTKEIISRICAAKQTFNVEVTTEYNSQNFRVTIDGTNYTFTSDTDATKQEIRDGLYTLIAAGDDDVTLTKIGTDDLRIENNDLENEMTVAITNPANGVLTLTEEIPFEDSIQFGAVVISAESVDRESVSGKEAACRLPHWATDFSGRKVLGVAMADVSKATRTTAPYGGYGAGEAVPILRKGRIWMEVEDVASVVVGGLVYVRHVVAGSQKYGAIRAADDGSDTEELGTSAQFTGQRDEAAGLAVVEWNLP